MYLERIHGARAHVIVTLMADKNRRDADVFLATSVVGAFRIRGGVFIVLLMLLYCPADVSTVSSVHALCYNAGSRRVVGFGDTKKSI